MSPIDWVSIGRSKFSCLRGGNEIRDCFGCKGTAYWGIHGSHSNDRCPILREIVLMGVKSGVEQLRNEYHSEFKSRGNEADRNGDLIHPKERLRKLGVPATAIMDLENLYESKVLSAAKKFVESSNVTKFLVLLGENGIGKSVAAAFVMRDFVHKFRWNSQPSGPQTSPAIWIHGKDLTSISERKDTDRSRLDELEKCSLLVLDELGDEATPIGVDIMANLLNRRADSKRQTVITSNLSGAGLTARYGKALADRLRSVAFMPNLMGEQSKRKRPEMKQLLAKMSISEEAVQ